MLILVRVKPYIYSRATYRTKYCFDYDDLGSSLLRIHVILKRLINGTFGIVQKYIDKKEIYVFVYLLFEFFLHMSRCIDG